MRKVTPDFPCPKCGSKLGDCVTDEIYDSWGLSHCKNLECDHVETAYDLINKKNLPVINI